MSHLEHNSNASHRQQGSLYLIHRLPTSSYTPYFRTSGKSIAIETCFTTTLHKHERTTNQAHLRDRCKNQRHFSRCILSQRITNCGTYNITVRLQYGPKPQTRRTLGGNLHRQRSTRGIF